MAFRERAVSTISALVVFSLVALLISACSTGNPVGEPPPPASGASLLRTDQRTYVAGYESGEGSYRQYAFDLVATFENRTEGAIYINRCYPDSPGPTYSVQLAGESESRSAYNAFWACVGHDKPIAVASGETRVDTLRITGPTAWSRGGGGSGEMIGVLEGQFRLGYGTYSCPERGPKCTLPDSLGRSNAFDIHLED